MGSVSRRTAPHDRAAADTSDIKAAVARAAQLGRREDTHLVHVGAAEIALLKACGGAGTINPRTGLQEFLLGSTGGGSYGSGSTRASAGWGGMSEKPGGKGAGGDRGQHNLPRGVTPMDQPKPLGATPYVEGASVGRITRSVLTSPLMAGARVIAQGILGKDPFGDDEDGVQRGWSASPDLEGRPVRGTGLSMLGAGAGNLASPAGAARGPSAAAAPPVPAAGDDYADVALEDRATPPPRKRTGVDEDLSSTLMQMVMSL